MKEYKASLDKGTFIFTGLISVLILGITILTVIKNNEESHPLGLLLGAILPPAILLLTYFFKPQKYVVERENISIKRLVNTFKIAHANIKAVKELSNEDLKGTIRTFGNGGLFGYYGWFHNSILGSFRMFATKRKNYILIITKDDKKYLITPDDESLINELNAILYARYFN